MAVDLKKYTEDLLNEAGASEEQKQAFMAILGNEKVANAFVPRPEFSRALDEKDKALKDTTTAAAQQKQQLEEWYQKSALPAYNAAVEAQKKVERYVTMYGELPDGTVVDPNNPNAVRQAVGDYISKKDLEEMLGNRDKQTIAVMKGVGKITAHHLKTFGEEPDLDAIEKIALEQGLSLDKAYSEYIRPKQEERNNKTWEEKLKAAKEEGLKEGLSRSSTPIDAKPREAHPFFDRAKPEAGASSTDIERKVGAAFVEEWNKATAAS